jgi:DNA replication and repair protein RecF
VEYVISSEKALLYSPDQVHDLMKKRLIQLHDAELSSGASLVGPQKHDLTFLYDGNDSRFYSSQGQQRALILSFKMAQIVYHRRTHDSYPLLMLDDVLSELDAEKRESLIKFLSEINTQIFITTTDFDLPGSLKSEDCAVINIREGQIRP